MPIITKNATTHTSATVFSCSGLGKVMPIASMIPLVNEISNRISISFGIQGENNGAHCVMIAAVRLEQATAIRDR